MADMFIGPSFNLSDVQDAPIVVSQGVGLDNQAVQSEKFARRTKSRLALNVDAYFHETTTGIIRLEGQARILGGLRI